jgi:hypothetical protein
LIADYHALLHHSEALSSFQTLIDTPLMAETRFYNEVARIYKQRLRIERCTDGWDLSKSSHNFSMVKSSCSGSQERRTASLGCSTAALSLAPNDISHPARQEKSSLIIFAFLDWL